MFRGKWAVALKLNVEAQFCQSKLSNLNEDD